METSKSLEHLAGITAKVRLSEERIMRAYSAHIVRVTRERDQLARKKKSPISSTSLEEAVVLMEPDYFSGQDTAQVDLGDPASAAVAAGFREIELPEIPEGEFPLDYNSSLQDIWKELQMRKARMLDDSKWCALAQEKIWAESQGRPITLGGREVATYTRDGNFARKVFEAEQPELTERYTRIIAKDALDTEALRRDYPKVYEAYRAPTLRFKTMPVAP